MITTTQFLGVALGKFAKMAENRPSESSCLHIRQCREIMDLFNDWG